MSPGVAFAKFPNPNFGITSPNEFTGVPRNQPHFGIHHGSNAARPKASIRLVPAESLELANIANVKREGPLVATEGLLCPCPYRNSGCREMVIRGTRMEQEHCQGCDFRPVRCILHTQCVQMVPYHDFILHLTKHFLQPNYTLDLTSFVLLQARDFEAETHWSPKWLATRGHQFFLMLKRREDGIWVSWVWMFGSDEEAKCFKAKISYFRGKRFITGVCPVHGIRKPEAVIEGKKACVMFTDQTIKTVSGIGQSLLSDLFVNVQIQLNTHRSAPKRSPLNEIAETENGTSGPQFVANFETETRVVAEAEKSHVDDAYCYLMDKLKSAFSHAAELEAAEEKPDGIANEFLALLHPPAPKDDQAADGFESKNAVQEVDKSTSTTSIGFTNDNLLEVSESNEENGGFASVFGNLSLSDLDPSWYLSASSRLFQSFGSKLNDLRLQIHSSLESAYESFQATNDDEFEADDEEEVVITPIHGENGDAPVLPPNQRPPGIPTYHFREFEPSTGSDLASEVD